MKRLTDEQIEFIIQRLREGKPLPEEFKWILFEPKQEAELIYAGKERDIDIITDTMAVPLQLVKAFGKIEEGKWHNMIIFGDNLQVLKELLRWKKEGKLKNPDGSLGVKLIYIDPPFGTGDIYGKGDVGAYSAKLMGAKYLEWLRKRLILLREILADNGSIYVRIDYHFGHYVKVLMDEIFGRENFRNEIIINRTKKIFEGVNRFNTATDSLFFYTKSSNYTFNQIRKPRITQKWIPMHSPGIRHPPERIILGRKLLPPQGRHWTFTQEKINQLEEEGRIRINESVEYIDLEGKKVRGMPEYLTHPEELLDSNWTDIPGYTFKWKYPTENSEQLLERVIKASSNPGDIVLDAFAGSGTTGAVAEKLGRRWIMIDIGRLAIYTMIKRMMNLKKGIGNKDKPLKPKPFAVYTAGLYDYKKIKELPWEKYREFALNLFQCKDEPHEINKVKLDGYYGTDHVMVFRWKNDEEYNLDKEFIRELHGLIGDKIGKKFFIIAPAASVTFIEDWIDIDGVRYYILRIPYSIIEEIHKKKFEPLLQPRVTQDSDVNAVLEQVGFDFIYPPDIEIETRIEKSKTGITKYTKGKEFVIKIKKFRSNVITKKPLPEEERGFKSLSMVMIDFNYNGEWFNLSKWIGAKELEKNGYEIRLPLDKLGKKIMIIYVDIWGNERKDVIDIKR